LERRALVALVAGAVGIAFAPIFVRWCIAAGVGPTAAAFWRLFLATPLLYLLARRRAGERGARGRTEPARRFDVRVLWPGLLFAGDLGVWHWSIHYTTVANATLLANFAPVFVTLFGWLLFRRRITRVFLAGMVVALAGMALLVGDSASFGGTRLEGDALGLLTAVFYGGYIVAVARVRETGLPTARLMTWASGVAALSLLPIAWLAPEPFWPPDAHAWGMVVGLALVAQIAGQGLVAYALAHLPAALSSVTLLLQPLCVVLLGWTLLDEALGPWQAAGGAVILAGIVVARRGSRVAG